MGSLLYVGLGKESPTWMGELLLKKDRSLAAPTFSADGLYLAQVGYPDQFEIPLPHFDFSAIPSAYLHKAFRI
jgi:tRNA pseudouridine38-40 synthase